jgi:hypothetical protein
MYGDDFDPDEISFHIGLSATSVRRKGERRPEVPLPRNSSWEVSTGRVESDVINVYQMSGTLAAQLAPYLSKIIEAKTTFNLRCVFQVVLWIDQNEEASMPAIGFESPVISFIHAVGAEIDIDTYRN